MAENTLFVSLSVTEAENLIKGWVSEVLEANKPENPESTLPKYRTRAEVCRIFKLSLPTLDRYCKLGLIRSKRVGNRILISEDDIKSSLKEGSRKPR